jgi:carbon-monoxide dehydrogenase medium subunit
MRDFEFESPATLDEAVAVLAKTNGTARCLAGGTDLVDHIRTGRLAPNVVIDIKKIPDLNVLELSASGLRLGAAVPCWKVYGDEGIVSRYSALADSCHIIGGIQIQSRASVGGNLCNSGPAADSTPSLIALGAVCVIAGPKGRREVPAEQFCTAPSKNILQPGEILVELKFPARPANSGSHYRRFIPRNEMDIAVVGVGASVALDAAGEKFVSARVALGAVAPIPLYVPAVGEALAGQPVNDATFAKAAEVARAAAKPIDDMRGTAEFRKHSSGVLTERVLREAVYRARGR